MIETLFANLCLILFLCCYIWWISKAKHKDSWLWVMQKKEVIQTTNEVSLRDMLQNPRVDLHRRIVTVKMTLWLWEAHAEYDDREQSCPHISCYSCFQPEICELKPDWSDTTSGKKRFCVSLSSQERKVPWCLSRQNSHTYTHNTMLREVSKCCSDRLKSGYTVTADNVVKNFLKTLLE